MLGRPALLILVGYTVCVLHNSCMYFKRVYYRYGSHHKDANYMYVYTYAAGPSHVHFSCCESTV